MVFSGAFQIRKHLAGQELEMFVFPHKVGKIRGEFIEQSHAFLASCILKQDIHILTETGKSTAMKLLSHPAFNQNAFFGQVNAIMLFDMRSKSVEFLISHADYIRSSGGSGYRF